MKVSFFPSGDVLQQADTLVNATFLAMLAEECEVPVTTEMLRRVKQAAADRVKLFLDLNAAMVPLVDHLLSGQNSFYQVYMPFAQALAKFKDIVKVERFILKCASKQLRSETRLLGILMNNNHENVVNYPAENIFRELYAIQAKRVADLTQTMAEISQLAEGSQLLLNQVLEAIKNALSLSAMRSAPANVVNPDKSEEMNVGASSSFKMG